MFASFIRQTAPVLTLLCFLTPVSCRNKSGSSPPIIPLEVQSATSIAGPELPSDEIFLNDTLIVTFSAPVQPSSVTGLSVRIRQSGDDGEESPRVDLVVRDRQVFFVAALPTSVDLSDSGFKPDTEYTLTVSSGDKGVRSLLGVSLDVDFEVRFRSRGLPPFLRDPVGGEILVSAVGIDLDTNGEISADGDPSTDEIEEFLDLHPLDLVSDAPVGLARSPLALAFLLSKPVDPRTVFEDGNRDGLPDRLELVDTRTSISLPVRLRLDQSYIPARDTYFTAIVLEPTTTLPPLSRIEARIYSGIMGLGGRDLGARSIGFVTDGPLGTFHDLLGEDFSTRDNLQEITTAEWDINDSNLLRAGTGIGGTGFDGALVVAPGKEKTLDTTPNAGAFHFTEIIVSEGGRLVGEGPNPLHLFSTGDVKIFGTIDVGGDSGNAGIRRGGFISSLGGKPGPGGGAGGNANDPPDISFDEENCQSGKPGVAPIPLGAGSGGKIGRFQAGGGGGGGFGTPGSPASGGANAASGGDSYGNTDLSQLVGGSGGGAGGDGSRDDPPKDESTGGGGGGGGGALLINCAGSLDFRGLISADGGRGGFGGGDRGPTPGGGGGGGGSGGAIKLQARTYLAMNPISQILARSGQRGTSGGGGSTNGGKGGDGRVRLEVIDVNGNGNVDPDELGLDLNQITIEPEPSIGIVQLQSIALSKFVDTGVKNARFFFDGSDPDTGLVIQGKEVGDILIPEGIPDGASLRIHFEGADEDPLHPRTPDLANSSGFTSRIQDLDGYQFIRFRIEFILGLDQEARPAVTLLRIPFEFDL